MATISKLSVQLTADTSPFSASMKAASKRLGSFSAKVKSISGRGLAGFGRGLSSIGASLARVGKMALNAGLSFAKFAAKGLLVAGAALVFFLGKAFKAIDATAKLSAEIGISTESITAYSLAAELGGIDSGVFTKGLQKMTRSLGEAKLGLGAGATGFKKLGLSMKDVEKLTPDEALNLVADRLSKIKDRAIQASIANDLFGRSGAQLLPIFDKGAKGLNQFRSEADRLGVTFSKLDAGKVEAANDSLTLMGKSIKGVFTQLAIKVAPFVERFAGLMTDAIVDFRNNTLPLIIEWVNTSVAKFRELLAVVLPVFFNFANGVADAIGFVIDAFATFGNFVGKVFFGFSQGADDSKMSFDDFIEGISFGITFARTAFESFGDTVDIIMFGIISSVAEMVKGFIDLIKKIPGVDKLLDFSKSKGFDVEGFVNDISIGSNALKEEAEDKLVTKFVANTKKNEKRTEAQTKKFLDLFDKVAGFGKFKFNEAVIKDSKAGADGLGLGAAAATKTEPKELQALEKGSAAAFKAINRTNDPAINLAKQGVAEQKIGNKQLKKIADGQRNNNIITVVPA